MSSSKIISVFLIGIFCVSCVFALILYDESSDKNYYYVSSFEPEIEVRFDLVPKGGIFTNFTVGTTSKTVDDRIVPRQSYQRTFGFREYCPYCGPYGEGEKIPFRLFLVDGFGTQLDSLGTPHSFTIVIDTTKPVISSTSVPNSSTIRWDRDRPLTVTFSEPLSSLKIYNVENRTYIYNFSDTQDVSTKRTHRTDSIISWLENGVNTLRFELYDMANNTNVEFVNFTLKGEPLRIVSFPTRQENRSIDYVYIRGPKYTEGPNPVIYTEKSSFNLALKTSKRANCYVVRGFSDPQITEMTTMNLGEINGKRAFTSNDGLLHSFNYSLLGSEDKFWVACEDRLSPSEKAYLSSHMGHLSNEIIKVKRIGADFNITSVQPNSTLTSGRFKIHALMSNNNIDLTCRAEINKTPIPEEFLLNSSGFSTRDANLRDDSYSLFVECNDLAYRFRNKTSVFSVNSKLPPEILSYNPKSTFIRTPYLTVTLSEIVRECVMLRGNVQGLVFTGAIGSVEPTSRDVVFKPVLEVQGENNFTLICEKEIDGRPTNYNLGVVSVSYEIPKRVSKIKDFSFLSGGREVTHLNDNRTLVFTFNDTNASAVRNYTLLIEDIDYIYNFPKETKRPIVRTITNLSKASKVKLSVINTYGEVVDTHTERLRFDYVKPNITISFGRSYATINCEDESECYSEEYGFSSTSTSCTPSLSYDGRKVSLPNDRYICAQAFDGAGNKEKVTEIRPPPSGGGGGDGGSSDTTAGGETQENITEGQQEEPSVNETNKTSTETNDEEPSTTDGEGGDDDPPTTDGEGGDDDPPTEGGDDINLFVILGIFIVFCGILGVTYYAYKKGLLTFTSSKGKSKGSGQAGGLSGITTSPSKTSPPMGVSYDAKKLFGDEKSHYNKLNEFISSTIDKKKNVFDEFSKSIKKLSPKDKEEKILPKRKSMKEQKEDFEEFYKSRRKGKKS